MAGLSKSRPTFTGRYGGSSFASWKPKSRDLSTNSPSLARLLFVLMTTRFSRLRLSWQRRGN